MSGRRFRVYIAQSLDGYIADGDGGVGWLSPYEDDDYGYAAFAREVDTVIMGRATFDQVAGFDPWPYDAFRTLVVSSRPLDDAPPGTTRVGGDIAMLVNALKSQDGGDIWVLGGAKLIAAFLDAEALDEMRIFVLPVLLGGGVPLFAERGAPRALTLEGSQSYPSGAVGLVYRAASG